LTIFKLGQEHQKISKYYCKRENYDIFSENQGKIMEFKDEKCMVCTFNYPMIFTQLKNHGNKISLSYNY